MHKNRNRQYVLIVYDSLIMLFADIMLLYFYKSNTVMTPRAILRYALLVAACVFTARIVGKIYRQIWRYGGIQCYIRLLVSDGAAFVVAFILSWVLPMERITFARLLSLCCINLLGALAMRMFYRYAYKCSGEQGAGSNILGILLRVFGGKRIIPERTMGSHRIRVAIVGAGRVGVTLAEELLNNPAASYVPRCFIDIDDGKTGREIHGLPVFSQSAETLEELKKHEIQEIVIAISSLDDDKKRDLFHFFFDNGYKVKVYDFPVMHSADAKRHLREFDVEELLFRKPMTILGEKVINYYRNKTVLISGGGGSIGSELSRQVASMQPKKLIILDVYENSAYDIQQELKLKYQDALDLAVEIVTITDRGELEKVFQRNRPDVVVHAAAHKHVPLMERNCCEAVKNNVFGTKNLVDVAESYGCGKFIMVSTDKAVNPTNVMGATKRMCEMIVLNHKGSMACSATRFGNVLGSNGSVIPLFKRQIMNGGPVTLTDRRIIRYFMTIPEAAQLVLTSGAIAEPGELFVLDMGKPVHIVDLAENMIRLSGFEPYKDIDIVETGLRPGEKLFEELLLQTDTMTKTENDQIFIEQVTPLTEAEIQQKLDILQSAVDTNEDERCREALHQAVETYHTPEEVNRNAEKSSEMQAANV